MTRQSPSSPYHIFPVFLTACILVFPLFITSPSATAQETAPAANNMMCLGCHNIPGFAMPDSDGVMQKLHVSGERFAESVHGEQACQNCHEDINGVPHEKGLHRKIGCVQCHSDLWEQAQLDGTTEEHARLGEVVEQVESYMGSIHARPSMADQGHTNATCYECHDAHYITQINGDELNRPMRLDTPEICGKCHTWELAEYQGSVHGMEQNAGNINAAVCIDCHTPHNIDSPALDSNKLVITQNCGGCHEESAESYIYTYHGQVNKLGYAFTAKCFDCHGSHDIKRLEDDTSKMHIDNRLETCRTCHEDATEGYASFQPHATSHDFEKYPQTWIATKFMIGLLVGTFAFFWLHSALWFFREYKDRKEGKNRPHIRTGELPEGAKSHIRRFPPWWRLAHLVGAVSIMTLVLTGVGVLYSESAWAPGLIALLGGPKTAAFIHRLAAIGFMGVFFVHLVYFALRIGRNIRSFQWFGPNSLIPNWADLKDAIAMFEWFLGQGPRPVLDKWTYWEKFDYWAPFWGMTIIGISGMMMWFPEVTATYLPGWVFNVSTIVHGEEAFLAAVFLFTVHFFNNHFRPDKFPQDITMFTGSVPLEIYRHEHRRDYERMLESGELEKYLVEAPSVPMTRWSKVLGTILIVTGLTLLTLVLLGFLGI